MMVRDHFIDGADHDQRGTLGAALPTRVRAGVSRAARCASRPRPPSTPFTTRSSAGLRRPPAEDDDLAGWLFVVAVRSGRRGFGRSLLRLDHARSRVSTDEIEALLDRMEVGRLLAGLTERQRAMVVAQFYLGLDHREIARQFGVKTGTVSATLAQAKARMRAEVRNVS